MVEDLCLHKKSSKLYERLQTECDRHIAAKLQALLANGSPDPVLFLAHVAAMWRDFCEQMLLIRSVFLYLDRTYAFQVGTCLNLRP